MANTSPFRMNPSLGPDLFQVVLANKVWYDAAGRGAGGTGQIASPQLGDTAYGNDGVKYIWVQASGTIAAAASPGTQVTLTVTGPDNVTAATGSGGFYAPNSTNYASSILVGDRFWAAKGTAP